MGGGVIPSSVSNPLYSHSSNQTLTSHSIVFYSEGAQYYNTFKPILDALDALNHPYAYYSSDENDPGLKRIKSHRTSLDSQNLESKSSCDELDSKNRESLHPLNDLDTLHNQHSSSQSLSSHSSQTHLDSLPSSTHSYNLNFYPSSSLHMPHTQSRFVYIGKGNKAYSFLNTLRADILVLTTPGLDVLHIKRQAGVKHYCHIVHSLSPMTYRVFGVDYFHSVLVANAVQRDFIRQIESAHNLKPKHIAITGSTYLDELYKIHSQILNAQVQNTQDLEYAHNLALDSRSSQDIKLSHNPSLDSECSEQTQHSEYSQDLEHSSTQQTQALKHSKLSHNPNLDSQYSQDLASHPSPRILISPSWGKESLLSKYALKLLLPLAQSGLSLLIRPHPQSSISPTESENLKYLKQALGEYKNVSWDTNTSNVYAFMYSDLMISDFSSVIFDYVCLQGKPVITIEDEMDLSGYDMADIPRDQIWTFQALRNIGRRIHPSEFSNLKEIILQIYKEYGDSQAKSKEKLDSGLDTEADSTLESQNLVSGENGGLDADSQVQSVSESYVLDSQTQTAHKQKLVSLVADSQNAQNVEFQSCTTLKSQNLESQCTSDSHSSQNTLDSLAHNLSSVQKLLWQYPHNAGLQSALELLKIERELLQNALKPQARLVARYTELEGMIQSAQAKPKSQSSLDSKVQSVSDAKPQVKSQAQTEHKQNLDSKSSCVDSGLDSQFISESESPPEHQTPSTHSSIDQSTHYISNH